MNEAVSDRYYAELSADYDVKIRQLVPGYDDMLACIVNLLAKERNGAFLEIGSGIGNLAKLMLDAAFPSNLTAVEVSDTMMECAASVFGSDDRVTLVHQDIQDFKPRHTFSVVYSNLVLHNLQSEPKASILAKVRGWLAPGGRFVWGDLIRHDDPDVQARQVRERIEHARASGCSDALIEWNFGKETNKDFPLTAGETFEAAMDAGFTEVEEIWTRDTFAIFCLR